MSCPKCRAECVKDANFCHHCGLLLKPFCVFCKIELPQDSHFCFRCGHSLNIYGQFSQQQNFSSHSAIVSAPQQRSPAPSTNFSEMMPANLKSKFQSAQQAITSERKLVSIVFADMSGFSSMSEKVDAEKLTDIMNQCFKKLGRVVYENEGYIDKFMGDCIMALFGAPIAHENDPELAIECALKMLAEIEKINQETGLNLGISIGINSGMVVAGGVGTDEKFEYTVMGDAVNIAQRLQTTAEKQQILVSKNIQKQCDKKFEFKELGALKVKGKEVPVEAFVVLGRKQTELKDKGIHAGYTPLIGREKEVQLMDKLLEELPHQRGQILLVSGEPGIGKSRLKHELKKLKQARGFKWFEAKCTNLNRETPYFVFIDLLHHILNIDPKADFEEQQKQIASLTSLGLDSTSEIFIRDLLNIQLPTDEPLTLDAAQKKRAVFIAVKNLLVKLSQMEPTVIYLEDLHWLDPLSLELLNSVMDATSKTALLIAGGLRPDFVHDWTQKKNCTQISLQPLTSEQSVSLVKTILHLVEVPKHLQKLIEAKSDGNPLYIEEIIKNLIDSGKISKVNDTWQIAADIEHVEIPATVQGIIASRIDRLREMDKQVLQYASIVGRRFSDQLLSKASGLGSELYESLKYLRKKEFIFEASSDHNEILYMFNHALMQDVAYQSILLKVRKVYHERVAIAIEENFQSTEHHKQDDLLEALAHHFVEAEIDDKAIIYLTCSGRQMAESFNNQGALKNFNKAIKLLETKVKSLTENNPQLIELYTFAAIVSSLIGDLSNSEKMQNKILEIAKANKDALLLSKTYRYLGEITKARGNLEAAIETQLKSLQYAVEANDYEGQIRTYKSLGNTWKSLNELSKALEIFNKGLEGARTLENTRLIAEYLNDIATVLIETHELDLAKKRLEESIEFSKKDAGLKSLLASSIINLGCVQDSLDDKKGALVKFREASKVAASIGDLRNTLIARHNIGEMLLDLGNHTDALKEFEDSHQIASDMGNHIERVSNRIAIGYLKFKLDSIEEGEKILREMAEEASSRKYWNSFCDAQIYLSRLEAERKNYEAAEAAIEKAFLKGKELNNQLMIKKCEAEREKLPSDKKQKKVRKIK